MWMSTKFRSLKSKILRCISLKDIYLLQLDEGFNRGKEQYCDGILKSQTKLSPKYLSLNHSNLKPPQTITFKIQWIQLLQENASPLPLRRKTSLTCTEGAHSAGQLCSVPSGKPPLLFAVNSVCVKPSTWRVTGIHSSKQRYQHLSPMTVLLRSLKAWGRQGPIFNNFKVI